MFTLVLTSSPPSTTHPMLALAKFYFKLISEEVMSKTFDMVKWWHYLSDISRLLFFRFSIFFRLNA